MARSPAPSEEIATFCSTTYGVTFPLAEKVEVNGDGRHPLYDDLTAVADAEGRDGDIQWNFEKFLVAPGGAGDALRSDGHPGGRRARQRGARSALPAEGMRGG